MYKSFIRPLLFSLDSEFVHDLIIKSSWLAPSSILKTLTHSKEQGLEREIFGLKFANPIGLAAGFDKNGDALKLFSALGFGHIEVGTVTPKPQPGNPKPRIFRSPKDSALINRMGFPSKGAEIVRRNIQGFREKNPSRPIIGINIGKQKDTPLENAHLDYSYLAKYFSDLADYFTVNISSPNTPGLRMLQEPERLKVILSSLKDVTSKPIVVKISPDLSDEELKSIVELLIQEGASGIAATNTTIGDVPLSISPRPEGGISGTPLFLRSKTMIEKIRGYSMEKLPIIGIGGVSTAEDVRSLLISGASLVQIYTGLIYEGPLVVSKILSRL